MVMTVCTVVNMNSTARKMIHTRYRVSATERTGVAGENQKVGLLTTSLLCFLDHDHMWFIYKTVFLHLSHKCGCEEERMRPEERRRNELYRQYYEDLQRRYDAERPVDCSVIVVNKQQK